MTAVSIIRAVSKACADLISMPFEAPLPMPAIIAVGVARPKAHGQDMTSTDMPTESAKPPPYPLISQQADAHKAVNITAGTKI